MLLLASFAHHALGAVCASDAKPRGRDLVGTKQIIQARRLAERPNHHGVFEIANLRVASAGESHGAGRRARHARDSRALAVPPRPGN